jgi:hypothetical protein
MDAIQDIQAQSGVMPPYIGAGAGHFRGESVSHQSVGRGGVLGD